MRFQRKIYCIVFFRDRISSEIQILFWSISILSVQYYETIADKFKISNLYFMIFIVQINKASEFYKSINLTTLGGCRIFLQQSKVSSLHPTCSLNFQIDSVLTNQDLDYRQPENLKTLASYVLPLERTFTGSLCDLNSNIRWIVKKKHNFCSPRYMR